MEYRIIADGAKIVIRTSGYVPKLIQAEMAKVGFSYASGKVFVGLAERQMQAESILSAAPVAGAISVGHGGTICSECANAVGRCSWSGVGPDGKTLRWEPVKGWTAVKTVFPGFGNKAGYTSYCVLKCPKFTKG